MSWTFRPWGQLEWVFDRLPKTKWDLICCVSPEERSLGVKEILEARGEIGRKKIFIIEDPEASRFYHETQEMLNNKEKELLDSGASTEEIVRLPLFYRTQDLVNHFESYLKGCSGNLIIDISVFPKRLFFPIVKLARKNKNIQNLICTYSKPETYSSEALSEDPEPWLHIPLFIPPFPEKNADLLIIGVGFQTLGLPDLIEGNYHDIKAKLLFPFPPGAPYFQRTWGFVRRIEMNFQKKANDIAKVDINDVSEVFDHICALTNRGESNAILAPYGPKTLSLAMCIYACLTDSPAYYTQPKAYNPKYSSGLAKIDGIAQINGYCLKLNGKELYKV